MKSLLIHPLRFPGPSRFALLALAFALLSGCLDKKLVWSPDGHHAAVNAEDGLYLTDEAGHLSPLLLPNFGCAAWLGDSKGLVLVHRIEVKNWVEAAQLLGPERAAALAVGAESAWREIQGGAVWSAVLKAAHVRGAAFKEYLREMHGPELQAHLTKEEQEDLAGQHWEGEQLVMARLEGDRIVVGEKLWEGLDILWDFRPSPDGRAVAFVAKQTPESESTVLEVVLTDGSSAPVKVATDVAFYPDWTPDSRALVYVDSDSNGNNLTLGTVAQRAVFDESGNFKIAAEPQYLAGVVFNGATRVRCLRDGRIIFNAAEFALPMATKDYGNRHDQLFALDPARQATLTRLLPRDRPGDLPQELEDFEVSPDEKKLLIGGKKGEVCIFTLSTGDVEVVQAAGKEDMQTAPVWRKPGEVTYEKRSVSVESKPPARPEMVLRRGDNETVLSAGWSDDFMKRLLN
jgi:hypothetical protein